MKLTKVLHLEIVLGRRGPKLLQNYYQSTVKEIDFPTTGGSIVPDTVIQMNNSERRALMLMRRWQLDNGRVYHVAKDFLSALAGIERGVSLDYLPERFVGYISFAEGTIFDDEDEVEGAYIYVGPSKYTSLRDSGMGRVLWIAYVCKGYKSLGTICMELRQGEMLDEMIHRIEDDNKIKGQLYTVPEVDLRKRALVHNVVLNVVMYVHSQEPNVQRIPGAHEISNRKASELASKTGLRNECTLPVVFVNWNYAKQRIYSVEKTWVETFPRWQPCGPNFSQIKLIWVREHERHYKSSLK